MSCGELGEWMWWSVDLLEEICTCQHRRDSRVWTFLIKNICFVGVYIFYSAQGTCCCWWEDNDNIKWIWIKAFNIKCYIIWVWFMSHNQQLQAVCSFWNLIIVFEIYCQITKERSGMIMSKFQMLRKRRRNFMNWKISICIVLMYRKYLREILRKFLKLSTAASFISHEWPFKL